MSQEYFVLQKSREQADPSRPLTLTLAPTLPQAKGTARALLRCGVLDNLKEENEPDHLKNRGRFPSLVVFSGTYVSSTATKGDSFGVPPHSPSLPCHAGVIPGVGVVLSKRTGALFPSIIYIL